MGDFLVARAHARAMTHVVTTVVVQTVVTAAVVFTTNAIVIHANFLNLWVKDVARVFKVNAGSPVSKNVAGVGCPSIGI
jgi:hypothetical protein